MSEHTRATLEIHPQPSLSGPGWARAAALLRAVALVAFLLIAYLLAASDPLPTVQLRVAPVALFWKLVVPLVPFLLVASPGLWRNICPLAALNMGGYSMRCLLDPAGNGRRREQLDLSGHGGQTWLARHGLKVAIILLALLVPARLLILNTNAQALFTVLLILSVAAIVAGLLFPFKAGWCSSICPVYPVEQAYGIHPLLPAENTLCKLESPRSGRLLTCNGCTLNCLDLRVAQETRAKSSWHPSPSLRFFIAVFPGFVTAYFLMDRWAQLPLLAMPVKVVTVYGCFVVAMAVSALLYTLSLWQVQKRRDTGRHLRRLDLLFVVAAFNTYYLMAVPAAAATATVLLDWTAVFQLVATCSLFAAVWLLSAVWLYRAW